MNNFVFEICKHYESLHDGDLREIGLQPKLCPAGYWTEGYGTLVLREGKRLTYKDSYYTAKRYSKIKTIVEAENALNFTLDNLRVQILDYLERNKSTAKKVIAENELQAMIDFAYNFGYAALIGSSWLKYLLANNIEAVKTSIVKWNKAQNPKTGLLEPLPGLTYRRQTELNLILTGTVKYFN